MNRVRLRLKPEARRSRIDSPNEFKTPSFCGRVFLWDEIGRSPKSLSDLVQGKRRNRVLRGFVHQIRAGRSPKRLLDLVQGKRRNRVLRGFVHQVRTGRTPKSLSDLVQGKRRNRVLRGFVHQVRAGRTKE